MSRKREGLLPSFKVWLRKDEHDVLGEGGASLLEAINSHGSIKTAAQKVGMSYKHAWDRLAEMQRAMGRPVLQTRKGGKVGGGGAELTETGKHILREYRRTERYVGNVVQDSESWEAIGLKISARNRLRGIVEKVEDDEVVSKVKIRVQTPVVITAVITREAVEDLRIRPGDKVEAVIKATEVMIAKS